MSLLLTAAGDTELIKEALKTNDAMIALHERSILQLFPSNDDVNRNVLKLIKSDYDLYSLFLTCKGFYSYVTDELLWNYRIVEWYGFNLSSYVLKYNTRYKDYYDDLSDCPDSAMIILAAEHGWVSVFKKFLSKLLMDTEQKVKNLSDDENELPVDYSDDDSDDDDAPIRSVKAMLAKMSSFVNNPVLRLVTLSRDCLLASVENNRIEILNIILDEHYDKNVNKMEVNPQFFDANLLLNCNIEILDRLSRSSANRIFPDAVTGAINHLIIPNAPTVDRLPRLERLFKFEFCHYSIVPHHPLEEKVSDIFIANMSSNRLEILLPWLHPNGIKTLLRTKMPITGKIIGRLIDTLKENSTEILLSLSDIIPADILTTILPDCHPVLINALPSEFKYTNLEKLRVEDLKLILKRKGLKISGKKSDIVQRIYDAQNK